MIWRFFFFKTKLENLKKLANFVLSFNPFPSLVGRHCVEVRDLYPPRRQSQRKNHFTIISTNSSRLSQLRGHLRVPFASVSKRFQVLNLSHVNQFYLQVHSKANQTHFHMKGFALGLALKQRQKATRKWPIQFV